MRREGDASVILRRLLERFERGANGRRIIERPAQAFADPGALRHLVESLKAAAQSGAVDLKFDRDAPHLIEQVILQDPERLYAFTGRTPAQEVVAAATRSLREVHAQTGVAQALVVDLVNAWGQGRTLAGLGREDLDAAQALVKAADAAFANLEADIPLRTRSVRLLGDSKALERALPSLLGYLKLTGVIDAGLSREDALEHLGLTKYAQPVLVAGPLCIGGQDINAWPYAGLPPEMIASVRPAVAIRSLLTIENLESFNRHVRSCRHADDVVVYTGGFPSGAVLALLRVLKSEIDGVLHHWGDIDPGGVRIGRHIETTLGTHVIPHLMDINLAGSAGRPPDAAQLLPSVPEGSAFFDLATYLRQPNVRWLEQEAIDPAPVCA